MPILTRQILLASVVALAAAVAAAAPAARPAPATRPAASTRPTSTTQPTDRPADRLDVLEAVFRHQFDKNASSAQKNVDYFFLALDGRADPPAELLARFKDQKPKVLPVSMAKASAGEGVRHKDLGGRGLIFTGTSITWIDDDTADVEGGYYEAGLSASGNTYRVTRTKGTWKVTGDRMKWIS